MTISIKWWCPACVKRARERYAEGLEQVRPGFVPAGHMAPMTGFPCNQCSGTGRAKWWDVPPYSEGGPPWKGIF